MQRHEVLVIVVLLVIIVVAIQSRSTTATSSIPVLVTPTNGFRLMDKQHIPVSFPESCCHNESTFALVSTSTLSPTMLAAAPMRSGLLTSVWNESVKVVDQGPFGSCTAFAVRYAYLIKMGGPEPSCAFWYASSRSQLGMSVANDGGSTLAATMKVLTTKPTWAEIQWPYTAYNILHNPNPQGTATVQFSASDTIKYSRPLPSTFRSPSAAVLQDFLSWIQTCINAGRSVLISIPVYSNFETYTAMSTGVIPNPSGKYLGGHAICLTGYTLGNNVNSSRFTFVNSWGTYTGLNGVFTIPYQYIGSYAAEAWSL